MKKIMIFAAVCATLVACSKEEGVNNPSFKKGQEVTLSVTADVPATKVTSALNSDGTTVDFKWEAGDQIKITVGSSSSVFTLVGDAGTSSAHFEGKMPESGTTFDIQYPVEEPDLTAQSYTAGEAIPHGMMKFTATGCSLGDTTFKIEPQNALLRLNLYGTDKAVSKIVVTNTSLSAAYTLNISGGKTLSTDSSNPTPFFVVVPAGDWNFYAEVFDNTSIPASVCTYQKTSTDAYFAANTVLNMPAVDVVYVPSPVISADFTISAGADGTQNTSDDVVARFSNGNLYYDGSTSSWGFESHQYDYRSYAGSSAVIDGAAATTPSNNWGLFGWVGASSTVLTSDTEKYGMSTSTEYSYYGTSISESLKADWADISTLPLVIGRKWHTLSSSEWEYLLSTRSVNGGAGEGKSYQRATINSDGTGVYGLIIYPDNYTSQTSANTYTSSQWTSMENSGCVFLPAGGCCNNMGTIYGLGKRGYYWSSTSDSSSASHACGFFFYSGNVRPIDSSYRYNRRSVRLVSVAK